MGCEMEPTAPQMPLCEKCAEPAQLQCGICIELFFCDRPACFEALHRARDREAHCASVTSYGTTSNCTLHPDHKLHLVCEDPCSDALICVRCDKLGHAGHSTTDVSQYVERKHHTLRSHVADLTKRRADAEEKCRVLEARPPQDASYKDMLLQTHTGYLAMEEGVVRSRVACEEDVARSFLVQAVGAAGEVTALKTFVAKAGDVIAECEAVCLLGEEQAMRVVTDLQGIVQKLDTIEANRDHHCLAGAVSPHTKLSLTLPVSHDVLAHSLTHDVPGIEVWALGKRTTYKIEVCHDDTVETFRQKVAFAEHLPVDSFHMCCGDKVMGDEADITQLAGGIMLTLTRKSRAIETLSALGETTFTAERLGTVADPNVASLLLQAEVVTAVPDGFLSGRAVSSLELCDMPVWSKGVNPLYQFTKLAALELTGLGSVTRIGSNFLSGCEALTHLNLSGLRKVTHIGDRFLSKCTALERLDLKKLVSLTAIGCYFLSECTALTSLDLTGLNVSVIGGYSIDQCTSLERYTGFRGEVVYVKAATLEVRTAYPRTKKATKKTTKKAPKKAPPKACARNIPVCDFIQKTH